MHRAVHGVNFQRAGEQCSSSANKEQELLEWSLQWLALPNQCGVQFDKWLKREVTTAKSNVNVTTPASHAGLVLRTVTETLELNQVMLFRTVHR